MQRDVSSEILHKQIDQFNSLPLWKRARMRRQIKKMKKKQRIGQNNEKSSKSSKD